MKTKQKAIVALMLSSVAVLSVFAYTSPDAVKARYEREIQKRESIAIEKIKNAQAYVDELNSYANGEYTIDQFMIEQAKVLEQAEAPTETSHPGYERDDSGLTHRDTYQVNGKTIQWRVNSEWVSKDLPAFDWWATGDERAKQLLDMYDLGYTFDHWKTLDKYYRITYSVPLCIAWADSGLGTQLKTENNLGNVGNNDRGDTYTPPSIYDGITDIFATINNKNLGKYTRIGELSNGGRKAIGMPGCSAQGEYCYATSEENWNNNVLNCLSVIWAQDIDEGFIYDYDGML